MKHWDQVSVSIQDLTVTANLDGRGGSFCTLYGVDGVMISYTGLIALSEAIAGIAEMVKDNEEAEEHG